MAAPLAPPGGVPDGALGIDFLTAVLDAVGQPVFVKDGSFRYVLANRAYHEFTGYAPEALIGKTDFDVSLRDEAAFFRAMDERVFAGETIVTEEPFTDAAGVKHALSTTKLPLRGEGGAITHVVGIIHDITRIKTGEDALRSSNEELERRVRERTAALQAAQSELVRSERLALLGQLAGGLAHQIRNPLGAITNAAYVIQRALARRPDDDASRAIAIILEEVWQANRIITDLIDYARVRVPERRLVDVAVLLEQALAQSSVPDNVEVARAFGAMPRAWVDPDQVRDALSNLVRNAVEAMPSGGKLLLRASTDGQQVILTIADTGGGIPREVRELLFEPLVTTKPLGLGLGLTTTRALIQNQGGSIDCESDPSGVQNGTRFVVRLPIEEKRTE